MAERLYQKLVYDGGRGSDILNIRLHMEKKMKEARLFYLIDPIDFGEIGVQGTHQLRSNEIELLKALVRSGNYYVSPSRLAEDFLCEHWLYLFI